MQVEDSPLPRIQEDIARLNERLHELSIQNYKQVVDARASLSRSAAVSTNLEATLEKTASEALPELRTNLSAFQDVGRRLIGEHKRTMATIDLHSQLVDLLQIPQLMDTCARSGSMEEALELCAFARTLKTRHEAIAQSLERPTQQSSATNYAGRGVEIVRWVAEEVEESAQALRRQLLQQLRGQVDLPTCLRYLSYLKRLDAQQKKTDPSTLKREFLEARDTFLQMQTLGTGEKGDPAYQVCLKSIQKNREIWFDVITQYQAIFGTSDEDAGEILSRWIGTKVKEFLNKLEESVNRFENCGELGTVYELSSSFAASLSRVGSDFRPLLPPIFLKRTKSLMTTYWTQATSNFKAALVTGEWRGDTPGESDALGIPATPGGSATNEFSPPLQVLSFPLLVELLNTYLRSFNDLRNFAARNLMKELARELEQSLEGCVEGLEQCEVASSSSQKRFDDLCAMFVYQVIPYVAKCFGSIFEWKYSPTTLFNVTGLSDRVKKLAPNIIYNVPKTSGGDATETPAKRPRSPVATVLETEADTETAEPPQKLAETIGQDDVETGEATTTE